MKIALVAVLTIANSMAFAAEPHYSQLGSVDPQLAQEFAKQDENHDEIAKSFAEYDRSMERLVQLSTYISFHRHWLLKNDYLKVWFPVVAGFAAGYYGYTRPSNQPSGFGKRVDKILEVEPLSPGQKSLSAAAAFTFFFVIAELAAQHHIASDLTNIDATSDEDVLAQYKKSLCDTNKLGMMLHFPEIRDTTGVPPVCN